MIKKLLILIIIVLIVNGCEPDSTLDRESYFKNTK